MKTTVILLSVSLVIFVALTLYTVYVRPITLVSTARWIAIVNRQAPDPWYRRLAVRHYWWSRKLLFGDAPLVIRPLKATVYVDVRSTG